MFLRKACTFIRNVISGGNDVSYQTCRFECDSSADLPAQNQTDYMIDIGSTAHDISANAEYMMNSSGAWVIQQSGTYGGTLGLGTEIPAADSLDDYRTPGVYYSATARTPAVNPFRMEVTYIEGTDHIRQTIYPDNSTAYFFSRVNNGASWYIWKRYDSFGTVGSTIPNGTNLGQGTTLGDLTLGRYQKTSNISTLTGLPSGFTTAFFLDVVQSVSTSRYMQILYPATDSEFGSYYMRLFTGNGWGPWYRFSGTAL